jgi:UDP-glucose 4-epimerase
MYEGRMKVRYLVTGGAGFIGSAVVRSLVAHGQGVRVLDDFSTGKRENLAGLEGSIELVEADISRFDVCRRACDGVEVVLHQAALPSVPRSVRDPIATHAVNSLGTLHMLTAARDADVRRFVFAGSSSAYGDSEVLPKHEDMQVRPQSPYAVSKVDGENYARVFYRTYGLEAVILRYFNVFGPRQDPQSEYAAVIPKFVRIMIEGGRPVVFGDGEQSRDFTFVDNVVEANLLAASAPAQGVAGEVFNVAFGGRITVNELIRNLNELLGTDVDPVYGPARPGDVQHSQADMTKARELLGYEAKVGFTEGLRRTVAHLTQASGFASKSEQ